MSYIINSIKGNEKHKTGLDILEDVIKDLEKNHGSRKSMNLLYKTSGSFNKVTLHEVIFNDGKVCKLATRESKVPVYKKVLKHAGPTINIAQKYEELKPSEYRQLLQFVPIEHKDKIQFSGKEAATYKNTSNITRKNTKSLAEIKEMENLTYKNWKAATADGICPHIYAYRYIEKEANNGVNLHVCSISEGYESDLHAFYAIKYKTLTEQEKFFYDNTIRMQLSNLFDKMSNNLGMLCNDIKPGNTVINTNPSNIDVKLIDFDSDYCKINNKHSTETRNLQSLMMQIIFANFFYYYFEKNNIFAEYFNQIKPHLDNNYDKMEATFSNTRGNDFFFTGKHYFRAYYLKTNGRPSDLWKVLYEHAFKDKQRKTPTIKLSNEKQASLKPQDKPVILFNQKSQSKPKVKQMRPSVIAAKEKALAWRNRLKTKKISPKAKVNNTRKKTGETKLQHEKRKALEYAKAMFGKK
tara:strand:- start:681 stop:2078 length:1398 start_codon:yes stop_codon:yes gene_type:complete